MMLKGWMWFVLVIGAIPISISIQANELLSWQLEGTRLKLKTTNTLVQITALSPDAMATLYDADTVQLPSFSLDKTLLSDDVDVNIEEHQQTLTFNTKNLSAIVSKSPFNVRFEYKNKYLVAEQQGFLPTQHRGFSFKFRLQPKERLLGGGERVLGMDRRGHRLPLYNKAHYGYGTQSKQMNFSIPAVVSSKKYTLLFDNSAKGWMDIGKTQTDVLEFNAVGGRKSYILVAGDSYPDLLQHYVSITGFQPLPPRWAFGNHASRFGYRSQKQVLDTISLFREKHVPVDSIILDLYWFGPDIQGHMGNLDWDLTTFPEPENMISALHNKGVKTVLITEPFVLTSSKNWQAASENNALAKSRDGKTINTFDFYFGNSGLIDVFQADGQKWFGEVYQRLAKQGVAGVWGDLGEPEVHPQDMVHVLSNFNDLIATADEVHNVYGHQWADLVQNSLKQVDPTTRPFMIMRSGFAGSQRYGMLPWTGDVSRTWQGLKPQVELSLQMGMLGMAYTHSDLGGFTGGGTFDREMYIRWLQYGVFQPIYRPHSNDDIAPEPVFHDSQTLDIIRDYINLRYRLLPYNYTLAYQNSTTGLPLMRPMFFLDEQDTDLIDINDQFFWGDNFLVKPVTEPNLTSIPVWLPKGIWFDFWSDKQYQGDQTINYPLDLTKIPVLVPAGAIIPTVDLVQSTVDYSSQHLRLDYYFHPVTGHSSAIMFEDNGISADTISNGTFEKLQFDATVKTNVKLKAPEGKEDFKGQRVVFELNKLTDDAHFEHAVESRSVELVVHNWLKAPTAIYVDDVLQPSSRFRWDYVKNQLLVRLQWQGNSTKIQMVND